MGKEIVRTKTLGELSRSIEKQLKRGLSRPAVINDMLNEGLDFYTAEELVNHIDIQVRNELRRGSTKDLTWGFVVLMTGIGISAGSYMEAAPGDTYMVIWGAVAYGLYRFSEGFYKKVKFSISPKERKTWVFGGLAALIILSGAGAIIISRMVSF